MLTLSRVKFEFYNDFPWIPYNIFLKNENTQNTTMSNSRTIKKKAVKIVHKCIAYQ